MGREEGLFSWLLSLMGIDPTTSIQITDKLVVFSQGSLEGTETRVIPMQSVCSAYYGYKKPWKQALALGVALLPLMGIGLLVGPIYYFLNKTLTVGVVENSGWVGGFAFKRSLIEGQNINEQDAHEVIAVIRAQIERKTA